MKTLRPLNLVTLITLFSGFYLLTGCGTKTSSSSGSSGDGISAQAWAPTSPAEIDTSSGLTVTPVIVKQPNGGGTALAVWLERTDLNPFDLKPAVYHLYARRFSGGLWATTDAGCPAGSGANDGICILDTQSADFDAWVPKAAMDDNGDAVVVWEQNDGTSSRVYARRFHVGAGACGSTCWEAAEVLDSGGGAASPRIALEPDANTNNGPGDDTLGSAMAVYERYDSTRSQWRVYARRLTGGIGAGTWGAQTDIGTGTICCTVFSADFSDSQGRTLGQYTSIAVDSSGNIHISYYDSQDVTTNNGALRYLETGSYPVVVDAPGGGGNGVGQYASIVADGTVSNQGRLYISYYDVNNQDLKFATCGGSCATATNWTKVCVDGTVTTCIATGASTINTGQYTSLAQDSSTGRLHLVYQNATANGVRYTTCLPAAGNSFCTAAGSWTAPKNLPGTVADTAANETSTYMSLAISASSTAGSPGVLHVAYQGNNANLKYYSCDITSSGTNCATDANSNGIADNWTVRATIPAVSPNPNWVSLAVGSSSTGGALGRLHIVFYNTGTTQLTYTTCDLTANTNCATAANWTAVVSVDTASAQNGQYTGLAVDSTGKLQASYYDATNRALRYATCASGGGTTCTTAANWTLLTADTPSPDNNNNNVGQYSSIAVDSDGTPHMSYWGTWQAKDKMSPLSGVRYATLQVGKQAYDPRVAMDNSGHAMATFIQFVQGVCYGIQVNNNDQTTQSGETTPTQQQNTMTILPLPPARCGDDRLIANRFEASTTSWQSPGPRDLTPPVTLASGRADCFNQNMDGFQGQGIDPRVNAFSNACVDISEVNLVMDRTGVAFVAFKSYEFNMAEQMFDSGGTDQDSPGKNCRNNAAPPNAPCDTHSTFNHQEIHINAGRFSGGSGGTWTADKILARWYFEAMWPDNQIPHTAASPTVNQNCGTSNNFTNAEDGSDIGAFLMNCNFSSLSLAVQPNGGGTAMLVAERYSSSTSSAANAVSDIIAFRFDGTVWNRWTGAAWSRVEDSGTATSGGGSNLQDNAKNWAVNEWAGGLVFITGGTGVGQLRGVTSNSNNQLTTTTQWFINPANGSTYQISSGYDPDTLGPIDTGSLDALAPGVVVDNAGNALVVWTQSDGTLSRIYSRCYANVAGYCGSVSAGWQTASIIDGNVGSESQYYNPVASVDGPGAAISLFIGFTTSVDTFHLYAVTGP